MVFSASPIEHKTGIEAELIMKIATPICVFTLSVIWGSTHVLAGEEPAQAVQIQQSKGQNPLAGEDKCRKLLAGVVHLSDDDLRFRTAGGSVVFVDPVASPTNSLAIKTGMLKPDLVLVTHAHPDHYQPAVLQDCQKLNPASIVVLPDNLTNRATIKGISHLEPVKPGQACTLAGIHFQTVPAYFNEGKSHPKDKGWVGYVLKLDGVSYYVTGDTEPVPEMAKVKADVLFPLLFGCGGNLDNALKMVEMTQPRLVVPVHHSDQEEVIKKFLSRLPKGVQGAWYKDGELIFGR